MQSETLIPWTVEELEKLVRGFLAHPEHAKVDFKSMLAIEGVSKKVHAELAKDVSAIANTDDSAFAGYGFMVYGVKDRQLVGGVDCLETSLTEKTGAALSTWVKTWVGPPPKQHLYSFHDELKGWWGVLVIAPSVEQPHIIIKDHNGNPKPGEWYVRINEVSEIAGTADYIRVLATRSRKAVEPFERRMADLQERLIHAEAKFSSLPATPFVQAAPSGAPVNFSDLDPVSAVRALARTPEAELADRLSSEARSIAIQLSDGRNPVVPWNLRGEDPAKPAEALRALEALTEPLACSLASIARYDEDGRLAPALTRAFRSLAVPVRPGTGVNFNDWGQYMRRYPLALCVYAVHCVAAIEGRGKLIAKLTGLVVPDNSADGREPILWSLRTLVWADDLFNRADQTSNFVQFSSHIRSVLRGWLVDFLVGTNFDEVFYIAEFVVGLGMLSGPGFDKRGGPAIPMPGIYLYEWEARPAIRNWLAEKPKLIGEALAESPEQALARFDKTVSKAVDRNAYGARGMVGGALEAYNGTVADD